MVQTLVASFEIRHTAYLDPDGKPLSELPDFASDIGELVRLYRAMVLTRAFDTKAVALQRTGRLGTFASSLGQEAVAVGIGAAMRADDVLVPSFREQGAQFMRGVRPVELLLYWGGDERGMDFAGPREDFPICVPIGTEVAHATGVALALQLRREPRAVLCAFGDGATSRGDAYSAMNYAGMRRLPVVYVVNNNQWALSVPRQQQSAAETLAQKAIAAGFDGEQVDGNDVIAVTDRIGVALEKARTGGGPTLIEALTYRLGDHTTADDASRYRDDDEVSRRWPAEPVRRLRAHLAEVADWSPADEERVLAECQEEIEAAATEYLETPAADPGTMFDHLYAALPSSLASQRDEVARRGSARG